MMFYHGTRAANLTELTPLGDEGVYLALNPVVAAFYIWDFDRNPCKWMGYRFADGFARYIEYFPDMLQVFYGGVDGYLYECEGNYPLNDKPGIAARVDQPVKPSAVRYVPDVYELLLDFEREGRLAITRYADWANADREYVRRSVLALIHNLDLHRHPENQYHDFVRDRFPEIWSE